MLRDLLYILHTFQLVFLLEQGNVQESLEYLELEMSPHRDVEMRSNNDRGNWFANGNSFSDSSYEIMSNG